MKISSFLTENPRGKSYKIQRITDTDNVTSVGYRYYYIDADNQYVAIPDDHPFYKIKRDIRTKLIVKKPTAKFTQGSGDSSVEANANILNLNGKNTADGTAEYDLKTNGWLIKDFPPGEDDLAGKPITGLTLRSLWNQLGVGIGGTTKSLDIRKGKTFGTGGKLDRYMTGKSGGFGKSTRADPNNSMFKKLFVSGGMNIADKMGMFGNANATKDLALDATIKELLDNQVNLGLGAILLDYINKFIAVAKNAEVKIGQSMGDIDNPDRPNKNPQESVGLTEAPIVPIEEPNTNNRQPPPMPGEEPKPEEQLSASEEEAQRIAAEAMQEINRLIDQGLKGGLIAPDGNRVKGISANDSFILLQNILTKGQLYPAYKYLSKVVPEYNKKAVATSKLSKVDHAKAEAKWESEGMPIMKVQGDKPGIMLDLEKGEFPDFRQWKATAGIVLPRDRNYRYYNPTYDVNTPGDRELRPNKAQKQANGQNADSFKGNLNNKVEYGKALKISRKTHPDIPFPPFAEWLQKIAKEIAVGSTVRFTSDHPTSKGKKIDARVEGPAPAYGTGFITVKSLKTADNPNPGPNSYVLGRHRIES